MSAKAARPSGPGSAMDDAAGAGVEGVSVKVAPPISVENSTAVPRQVRSDLSQAGRGEGGHVLTPVKINALFRPGHWAGTEM
ncbi:hypothetical protein Airi02_008130 [Actinoallomurus iriomotensis]|uniref:Uncharacterized protein n=1 Tax=Actinoallomurus iriomotensis TaxID=478107 RepID=A0A9W6VS20_9ACTN|nr:hypothetical protein Airi02_008130 [Actinoallomurus iriomotensis]